MVRLRSRDRPALAVEAVSSYAGSRPRDHAAATPHSGSTGATSNAGEERPKTVGDATAPSSSASRVTRPVIASHGAITGVSQADTHLGRNRRTGSPTAASNCGSRPARTVSTSAAMPGAPVATEAARRPRHGAQVSRWASSAHTVSAAIAVSPRA